MEEVLFAKTVILCVCVCVGVGVGGHVYSLDAESVFYVTLC